MDFGNIPARKRRAAGLTQVELAEALGIGSTYVSHVECGRLGPFSADLLIRAAGVLGCDVDELLGAAGKVAPEIVSGLAKRPALVRRLRSELEISQ